MRICLSQSPDCSGLKPCPACWEAIKSHIVVGAMSTAGGPFSEAGSPWPLAFLHAFTQAWHATVGAVVAQMPSEPPSVSAALSVMSESDKEALRKAIHGSNGGVIAHLSEEDHKTVLAALGLFLKAEPAPGPAPTAAPAPAPVPPGTEAPPPQAPQVSLADTLAKMTENEIAEARGRVICGLWNLGTLPPEEEELVRTKLGLLVVKPEPAVEPKQEVAEVERSETSDMGLDSASATATTAPSNGVALKEETAS